MGGLLGYDSSNVRRSLNVPSSKGVSPGVVVGLERGEKEMGFTDLDQI